MHGFDLASVTGGPLRVLCLGAHADDIEIGCGGTLLKLTAQNPAVSATWIVLSARGEREKEARASAEQFLAGAAEKDVRVEGFRDGFFPYTGGDIKEYFEALKKDTAPDVIFTHARGDLHQDHRLVNELTWNTFRDHLILEYEVIKYDGDLGQPNFFVHLDANTATRKAELLWDVFETQRARDWFTKETFIAMMRVRGVECRAADGFAEGFHCRKIVIP